MDKAPARGKQGERCRWLPVAGKGIFCADLGTQGPFHFYLLKDFLQCRAIQVGEMLACLGARGGTAKFAVDGPNPRHSLGAGQLVRMRVRPGGQDGIWFIFKQGPLCSLSALQEHLTSRPDLTLSSSLMVQ